MQSHYRGTRRGAMYGVAWEFDIRYKGFSIGEGRLDLLIDNKIIVELKSVEKLMPIHNVQVNSYLKATELQLALLINFNVLLLRDGIKRIILT